jgi:hypothetical protein
LKASRRANAEKATQGDYEQAHPTGEIYNKWLNKIKIIIIRIIIIVIIIIMKNCISSLLIIIFIPTGN